MGQHVGEAVAGADEGGGGTAGTYAFSDAVFNEQNLLKSYQRITGENLFRQNLFVSQALAAACSSVSFGSCSASSLTKSFDSCSFGTSATITGTVTLGFSGTGSSTCTMGAVSSAVARTPDYKITGVRGATFSVSGGSQTVTKTGSGTYSFTNTGIKRTFTTPKGVKLLDVTTETSSAITITGASRSGRTMSGGALKITNNLTGTYCTIAPSSVTWSGSSCNCPTSGSFTGSCNDNENFTITFGACGSATVVKGSESKSVSLDRCL